MTSLILIYTLTTFALGFQSALLFNYFRAVKMKPVNEPKLDVSALNRLLVE
jgi:hypothetical protein